MAKILKVFAVVVILLALSVLSGWYTLPRWLPLIASHWLPQGVTLSLSQPRWTKNALWLDELSLKAKECEWINVSGVSVAYLFREISKENSEDRYWNIHAANIDSQSQCLAQLPVGEEQSTPLSVQEILSAIPSINLAVDRLALTPWTEFAGKFQFSSSPQGQIFSYQGEKLELNAHITDKQDLVIQRFFIKLPEQVISLNGNITLPLNIATLPEQGQIITRLSLSQYPEPLQLALKWQGQSGRLTVIEEKNKQMLAELPWSFDESQFQIINGKWQWFETNQVLSGGVNITLEQWKKGLPGMFVSGRINLLTRNDQGKGNIVLSVKPTLINIANAHIPFQLTGQMNSGQMVMAMSLPAVVTGPLVDPKITFRSGALFRAWGKVSETFTVKEARLPLAGTYLTRNGFTGRLQAILTAQDSYWGKFKLHMDGSAKDFIPDQGNWNWRYWGGGNLPPLQAKWDIAGKGSWNQSQITVDELNTGFDLIQYGLVKMQVPRLKLTKPLIWERAANRRNLTGDFQLSVQKTEFHSGSFLPSFDFNTTIAGESPNNFILNGKLYSKGIGPIPFYGRWDGERLRGKAHWPRQSLLAFQSLIPPDLGITVRGGNIYAQAAFSAAKGQGLYAGGHWVVKNAGMWLKNGEVDGLNFILPWRLQKHTWQLGLVSPAQLRIKTIKGLFEMQNVAADLLGYYPPTGNQPLKLTNVNVDILDGKLDIERLQIPQKEAAVLRFNKLNLSKLIGVLKVKQMAMSGRISGELPVLLNDKRWIIPRGWASNEGYLTLRLDKDTVDSIGNNDLSAGMAMDWLRYLEISRLKAYVTLDNLGILTLHSEISGVNPVVDKKREVRLNYHHEENIFQLWRSLRFGSNLEEWLQKNISVMNGSNK
ncbi:YdbH family protein [Xenorhabdus anantnagensis]|uniref:YdbH family protein n=1 Tax=Xenorhabdus anantnagensis TaxID=3025875 RepID=A0ABT5LPS5_9GAMM|nr:YdbH family protein [Xenorhabdus anantnagensis]MDC9596320.1 YdbH family protein [Xenorhabdus anantnagensis]